jgi:hypothetical protein
MIREMSVAFHCRVALARVVAGAGLRQLLQNADAKEPTSRRNNRNDRNQAATGLALGWAQPPVIVYTAEKGHWKTVWPWFSANNKLP